MISPLAVVGSTQIGHNVQIREFAVIRSGVRLGDNVVIHPHVVIESGVEIGDGVEVFPGAFIGKEPKGAGWLAHTPEFERKIKIGANSSIGPHAVIFYDVEIGENVLIGDGTSIRERSRVGNRTIIGRYVTINYNTQIGAETKVLDHSWLCGNMSIGNRVFISGGVMTANDSAMGRKGYGQEWIVGPEVQDEAAIGVGAVLLPQVVIGKGAIVGAGAVVTKDVSPSVMVMGIPAKESRQLGE